MGRELNKQGFILFYCCLDFCASGCSERWPRNGRTDGARDTRPSGSRSYLSVSDGPFITANHAAASTEGRVGAAAGDDRNGLLWCYKEGGREEKKRQTSKLVLGDKVSEW